MVDLLAKSLCPVFFVLALGYYAGKRKIIDNHNPQPLIAILMSFALPCSLFATMANSTHEILRAQLPVALAMIVVMLAIFAATWAVEVRIYRQPNDGAAIQALTVAFPNCVAVGIPLLSGLYGPTGLVPVDIAITVGALTVSPLTLSVLERVYITHKSRSATSAFGYAVLGAFKKPVVLAPLFGFLVALSGVHLPGFTTRMLMLIGAVTGGLALFLTGLIISAYKLRMSTDVIVGTALKNLGQVCVMIAIAHFLPLSPREAREALLISALPAGFFGSVFGPWYGASAERAASTLAASTILSIITLAIVLRVS
jgi:predicted permease